MAEFVVRLRPCPDWFGDVSAHRSRCRWCKLRVSFWKFLKDRLTGTALSVRVICFLPSLAVTDS